MAARLVGRRGGHVAAWAAAATTARTSLRRTVHADRRRISPTADGPMKVLVAGASGFVGSQGCWAARSAGRRQRVGVGRACGRLSVAGSRGRGCRLRLSFVT